MKKIFTLIAAAFVAASVSAQTISWSEAADAGTLNGTVFKSGDVTLTVTDTKDKCAVDKNSQYFGDTESQQQFGFRFKTGGKSSKDNKLVLSVPSKGMVKIYARSGSGSATDRNVVCTQNEATLLDQIIKDEDAVKATINDEEKSVFPVYGFNVEAGTVDIIYPTGSINFYAIEFVANGTNGINSVNAEQTNGKMFNLAGQEVKAAAKGIVIKNGKKYMK